MARAARFVLPLVIVLGLLTWLAASVANQTSRRWFERDMRQRARLALSGARQALVRHWDARERVRMGKVLGEIAHDSRIMGVAACDMQGRRMASTPAFPAAFSCERIFGRVVPAAGEQTWRSWNVVRHLGRSDVYASALPLRDEHGGTAGYVTFLQDMDFVNRREAATRSFYFGAFAVLALAASIVTVVVARLTLRGWIAEVRRSLRGTATAGSSPELRPIVREVRELVGRIISERETGNGAIPWTAARLKQTLRRYLHGEKVIIVANREPYIHERTDDGGIRVIHPASGLVTALEPVMRACSGVWIAHGSGSADRETVDANGRVWVPPNEESYAIRRVWLSPEEEKGYYYGFANEGLWALCHHAHTRPMFRRDDWLQYQRINQRFADAACAEADSDDPIILVQDYHFALVPMLIRRRLPRSTILTFWHIPWPSSERFGICPFYDELLAGLLGSSILGFHTQVNCNNFLDSIDRFLEARIDRDQQGVVHQRRTTLVRAYPISIEWPSRWLKSVPEVEVCRRVVLDDLGLPSTTLLGVGVDRLDYTKGIEERLQAVERMLELFPELQGRFTFVQLAAPSRTEIERYRELAVSIERLAARINSRFGNGGPPAVILLRAHHEPPTVFRYYRAANVCYVSSLHDGMNLVAKEFVAARDDERGVLVLSYFTGAARELTEALIVNPYDLDQAATALATALSMSREEQAVRMRAMRSFVSEFNVYRWAGRMLVDANRLRERDRISEQFKYLEEPTALGTGS